MRVSFSKEQLGEKSAGVMKRLQAGDSSALGELFEMYAGMVASSIRQVISNEPVVEDLQQETFLRAFGRARQWREDDGTVGQWLSGIARHCALDFLKSADQRLRIPGLEPEMYRASSNVETTAILAERQRLLAQAIEQLLPEQRQVIELAYFGGLSQTSIAGQLKEPLGTIKGRTRSALMRLRASVDPSTL
jgi:RNA polymerase sigma-70 factor (ECF subfamily)